MKVTAVPVNDVTRVNERAVTQRESLDSSKPQEKETAKGQEQVSKADAERLAEKMNAAAELFNKALQFKVFDGNRIIIKVVDTVTDEVLSEFPPERLLEAFKSMEASLGLLVDKKV